MDSVCTYALKSEVIVAINYSELLDKGTRTRLDILLEKHFEKQKDFENKEKALKNFIFYRNRYVEYINKKDKTAQEHKYLKTDKEKDER